MKWTASLVALATLALSACNSTPPPAPAKESQPLLGAVPRAHPKAPAPPSALTGVGVAGKATLTWRDNSSNETGFILQRTPILATAPVIGANATTYGDLCGPGTFLYRIAAYNGGGTSAYSSWITVTVPPAGGGGGGGGSESGWTSFTASADSLVVYVSSSAGNDANSGLSPASPKATLAAGAALLRDGFPDWLLLRCGDSWHEVFKDWPRSGRSETELSRLGSYGTGPRPHLFCGADHGIYSGSWDAAAPRRHIAFTDICFTGEYDGTTGSPAAIRLLGNWSDVLIENCYAERFFQAYVFDCDPTTQTISNVRLRRDVGVDSFHDLSAGHPQGAYFGGVNGLLIEECLFDHNGWSETIPGMVPTIFRHNIYIQSNCQNVTTRGIISARAGATGMQQRCGGICEGHLFLANPINIVFGTGGTVRNCVVIDSRDIDAANPRGIGIQCTGGTGHDVYGNICTTRTYPGTWNIQAFSIDGAWGTVNLHDNIAWNWFAAGNSGSCLEAWGQPFASLTVTRNRFYMPGGGDLIGQHVAVPTTSYGSNTYLAVKPAPFTYIDAAQTFPVWSAARDPSVLVDNAGLVDPGRTTATYMGSLGKAPTLEAFLAEARLQARGNWRAEYTAAAVNAYVRAGFAASGN